MSTSETVRITATASMATMGLLSMISALSILITIGYFRLYKHLSVRLIAYLAISDLFQGMTAVLSFGWLSHYPVTGSGLCRLQGWMFTMFDVSSSFLALAICSFTILSGFHQNWLNKRIFETAALVGSFGLPFIFATAGFGVAPSGVEFYGNVGVWCWIVAEFDSYRFIFAYAWIFSVMILLVVCYAWIAYKLYKITRATDDFSVEPDKKHSKTSKIIKKLAIYPIIFFIVFFPLGIQRILVSYHYVVPISYTYTAICIFVTNGFFNAVAYGVTRGVFEQYTSTSASGEDKEGKSSKEKSSSLSIPV